MALSFRVAPATHGTPRAIGRCSRTARRESRPPQSKPCALPALLAMMLAAGCAAGPPAAPSRVIPRSAEPARPSPDQPRPDAAAAPAVSGVSTSRRSGEADFATFPRSSAALRREIGERADALRTGPIGNRARQLASLRLASSGRELIVSGSPGGAIEALEKALSLYDANGYAYLFLASVREAEGRRDQAHGLAANAARYLPGDEGVQAELEHLVQSIGKAR